MATKPKAKPVMASKETPSRASKSAPKVTPKSTAGTTLKAPVTESKVTAKTKSAPKAPVVPEPSPVAKTVKKAASSAKKTKPESPEAKPVIEPVAGKTSKAGPAAKAAAKSPVKPEPPPSPKAHKWHEIKIILEKMKKDILIEIDKSVKNGADAIATNEPGGDIYDQASSERDRELGLLLGDREREKLHSVDEALLRIAENEYGICEECDEDIPLGRLKAMPFTRHCVKCKSDLEKLQAQTKRFEEDRAYREIPLGSEEEEA